MQIVCTAIDENGHILRKYTCQGENVNPPLTFTEVPPDAQSLALIMDDPDAPNGTFTHWVLFNMTPDTQQLPENEKAPTGVEGVNDFGRLGYRGPCPPSGTHRYFFKLYALDSTLDLKVGSSKTDLLNAMEGHILEQTETAGTYSKN